MDEQNAILDEIKELLRDMYSLAERAARDDCPASERQVLQERLDALQKMLDEAADRLQNCQSK